MKVRVSVVKSKSGQKLLGLICKWKTFFPVDASAIKLKHGRQLEKVHNPFPPPTQEPKILKKKRRI